MKRSANTVPLVLKKELFDYLLIGLAVLVFLDLVVTLVFLDSNQEGFLGIRKEGFRMAACWVLLATICLASDHLRNYRLAILVISTAVGSGVQWASLAAAKAQGAQYTNFEMTMSVFSVYFTLPTFMVLLVSTKVDNLQNQLDKERARLQRANAEGNRIIELLKKSKEQKQETEQEDEETNLARRRHVLECTHDIYQQMVKLKFRREINALLEDLFATKFGFPQGFVLEAPEEGREMKVKNVWGFQAAGPELDKQIGEFKDRALTAWVFDRKEWLDHEKILKLPNLFEVAERFAGQLFPVAYVIPLLSLNRTVNVVYLAAQSPSAPVPFDYALAEPYLAALGLVLTKISGKSAKPQFASFTPG
ncbi:MAG: hypothetical protein HY814_10045 [Candidatus Riflebacteria bacterium]|nr:hypothetical protein [Candidatus Riflebacteria bacterium]